jgi:hypothetical protein
LFLHPSVPYILVATGKRLSEKDPTTFFASKLELKDWSVNVFEGGQAEVVTWLIFYFLQCGRLQ